MSAADALRDIEDRLASCMVTYKENATEDAPRLVAAVEAVLGIHRHCTGACPEVRAIETALGGAR